MTRPLVPTKNGIAVSSTILSSCARQPCDTIFIPAILTLPNTPPSFPGTLTPDGYYQTGTGFGPDYTHLVTNGQIELYLAPAIAGVSISGPSAGNVFDIEAPATGDVSTLFGASILSGDIVEQYDVTLRVEFEGRTRTLVLQGTGPDYVWVDPLDPSYVITDSATSQTTVQNVTRVTYLFPDVEAPAEGTQHYVLQATDKTTGQTLTNSVTLEVSVAKCNTTDTDNGLVRFTAGNVGGQRTGLLRSVGSNQDMGEPDSPLPASWIPFEASGQAGLLLRIGVNPIGNEEYMGGTIQLMDEDCNPIGAPVGPITVNAASGLMGVNKALPALAKEFTNGRVLSVQFIKPAPTPPDLQPDWSENSVTFGFTPGQVTAQSAGVNYQETPTQPQAGTMLQPEPDNLVNIRVEQYQMVPPGEPFMFSGHIANAPATYAGATWKVIDHEGTLRGEGTTSYDPVTQRLTLNTINDLAGQTKYIGSANPVFVTLTKD